MSAKCPVCGRFCRATQRRAYDGTWEQVYVTTYCKDDGERTEATV